MIPILYTKNGCSTKHPLKNGCLVYQEHDKSAYPFAGRTASSGCFGIMRKPHGVEEQDSNAFSTEISLPRNLLCLSDVWPGHF